MADEKEMSLVNGVAVESLKATIQAIQSNPGLASFQFRVNNRWLGGSRNRSEIQGFYGAGREDDTRRASFVIDNDEPLVFLGQDHAPNPVEWVLHALAGCLTTTMVYHAAARGIEIQSIESKLEGEIDIRGFLGLSSDVRKGYQKIKVTFRVKSDAPAEKLSELAQFSPVFDTITQPVPVDIVVEKT